MIVCDCHELPDSCVCVIPKSCKCVVCFEKFKPYKTGGFFGSDVEKDQCKICFDVFQHQELRAEAVQEIVTNLYKRIDALEKEVKRLKK